MTYAEAMRWVSRFDPDWLYRYNERAAIREYDGGMDRESAEINAVQDVLKESREYKHE